MDQQEANDVDIQKAWQKMAEVKFSNNPIIKKDIMKAITEESNSTINYLNKGLKQKVKYATAFGLLFIILIFVNKGDVPDQIFCGSLSLAYFIGAYFMHRHQQNISSTLNTNKTLLEQMKHDLKYIKSTLRIEAIWGAFAFLSIIAFYITKYTLKHSGDPSDLAFKIVSFILICALLIFLAIRMTKNRFGNDIKKIEENIIRLETLT